MTPYEQYENKLKEQARQFKKEQKEKRKLEKQQVKERKKKEREKMSGISTEIKNIKREKAVVQEEHRNSFSVQLDIEKAIKEYNDRKKMSFENVSLKDLLHTPK